MFNKKLQSKAPIRRILSVLLSVLIFLSIASPITAFAADTLSGTTGDCKWSLNTSTGVFTVSGKGAMANSSSDAPHEWADEMSKITSVVIKEGVTSIGSYAFAEATGNASVSLPSTLKEIGFNAFYHNKSLESITIPKGVTTIGGSAFIHCSALKEFTFPTTIKTVGRLVFFDCPGLTSITVPDGAECSFETDCVQNCTHLEKLYLGDKVASLYGSTFSGAALKEIMVSSKNKNYCSVDGVLYNKAKTVLINYPKKKDGAEFTVPSGVREIGDFSFYNALNLTKITLPKNVTSIGMAAFQSCWNLTDINIPDSVVKIGKWAFTSTPVYDNMPDGVVYMGKVAYKYKGDCPSEVTLKAGTKAIADNAFEECTALEKITLPSGLLRMGEYSFRLCANLSSLEIPSSVTYIGGHCFTSCKKLESIKIPNNVTELGEWAFSNCQSLSKVTLSKNLKKIDQYAFNLCNIESITLPDSLEEIGKDAFLYNENMKEITILDTVKKIDVRGVGYHRGESGALEVIDGFTIRGYEDTEAQRYAVANKINFISLGKAPTAVVDNRDDVDTVDKQIKGLKNDKDPKNSVFNGLMAKAKKCKKTSITVSWRKLKDAKKYIIYGNKCGYKNGKYNPYKKLKVVTKNSFKQTGLKKGTYYKYLIVAYDKNKKVISISKTIHATTSGGKRGNDKSVKVNKASVTVKAKKTFAIKAVEVAQSKPVSHHRKVKFESSNTAVAKVSSKGLITAKKAGKCYIYAYAQNGVYKKIKVTVK